MTLPVISAAVAAFILILQLILMVMTGASRAKSNIFIGTGDDPDLERKIRRHGNLAENSGIFVITLALAEIIGVSASVVTGFGVAFIAARLAHAISFNSLAGSHGSEGSKIFAALRVIGAFGTLISGIGLAGYLLYTLYSL